MTPDFQLDLSEKVNTLPLSDADKKRVVDIVFWAMEQVAPPKVTPAAGVTASDAPSKGIYVECHECADCGHAGINDAHPTDAACNSCGWRGPSPKEDRCPSCGKDGTMIDACPKCGCGRYTLVADATVDVPGTLKENGNG